jgi:hypothetical protein
LIAPDEVGGFRNSEFFSVGAACETGCSAGVNLLILALMPLERDVQAEKKASPLLGLMHRE